MPFLVAGTLMMEATESPLDVLSRAATMVQDSSPPDYGEFQLLSNSSV
jgi:hypothetical protein